MKTIAIIGGGFSGTMAAVNLARLTEHPLKIVIINTKRPLGRGTAYGTKRPEHLLNVAARNMSALPDFPSHFLDWLRSRNEFDNTPDEVLRETFVPRQVYGDYLRSLLAACINPIDLKCQVKVESINDEAIDVVFDEEDVVATVLLKNGESVEADQILLATGNQPPGSFPSASPLGHDSRYCADPWSDWENKLPNPGGRIVLLGTGLTMVDVVLTLGEIGWKGEILALSRNGMLPKSHFRGIAYEDYIPENAETLGLPGLLQLIEHHCNKLKQMSQNAAIAIDKLRPHTQRLWKSLTAQEKREFLQLHAANWNVTRHRIAVSIHGTITDALDCGRLKVVSGSIQSLVSSEENIGIMLKDSDGNESQHSGDLVINCTGPQAHFSETRLPLFENLLNKGFVRSDEVDLGIEVDKDFLVVGCDGVPTTPLYAIGPLLKGSLWETTAVPELRVQAMRVAEILLEREPAFVEKTEVLEYYI